MQPLKAQLTKKKLTTGHLLCKRTKEKEINKRAQQSSVKSKQHEQFLTTCVTRYSLGLSLEKRIKCHNIIKSPLSGLMAGN